MTLKEKIVKAVRDLPSDATIEDAMERLHLMHKIEIGLAQADAGRKVSHQDAGKRLAKWLK